MDDFDDAQLVGPGADLQLGVALGVLLSMLLAYRSFVTPAHQPRELL